MKRGPVSRTGTIGKPRRRADGTHARRIWWYDADGVRQSEYVTGDREAAQRRLDTHLRDEESVRVGQLKRAGPAGPTLSDLTVRVEKEVLPARQRAQQRLSFLKRMARWWEPELGARPIETIEREDIEAGVARMRAAKLKPASCNRNLSALSVVFEAAKRWRLVGSNPCHDSGLRMREGRKVPRFLTETEAAAVIAGAEPEYRPLFVTAIYTGMRFGELAALRWRDVDLEDGQIFVRRSHDGDPKTGDERPIPIHRQLQPHLEQLAAAFEDGPPPDYLVFQAEPTWKRPKVDPRRDQIRVPRKALLRALKAAGVRRHLSFYDLRHTFGTLAVGANVGLRDVQDVMGHASLGTTTRYVHALPDRKAALSRLQLPTGEGDAMDLSKLFRIEPDLKTRKVKVTVLGLKTWSFEPHQVQEFVDSDTPATILRRLREAVARVG